VLATKEQMLLAYQLRSKWAKTIDSRMASHMGHFKLAGSPKHNHFTHRRRLAPSEG